MKKFKLIKIVIAVILVSVLFLAACTPDGWIPTDITLIFGGEVNGRLEFEFTGNSRTVTVNSESALITYNHDGTDDWVEIQPTAVGNHQVRAVVDTSLHRASHTIPFVITRNRQASISASNQTIGSNHLNGFNFIGTMLNMSAIENATPNDVTVSFKQGTTSVTLEQLTVGIFEVHFDVVTATHESSTSATLTVTPFEDGFSSGVFTGFTHTFDGTAQGITVNMQNIIPTRDYLTGDYVVRYNGYAINPIFAGTYDVTVDFGLITGDILTIDAPFPLTIERRQTQLVRAENRNFAPGESITFGSDLTQYLTTDLPETANRLFMISDLSITFARIESDGNVPVVGIPTQAGEYLVTFSVRADSSNFAAYANQTTVTAIYTLEMDSIEDFDVTFTNLTQTFTGNALIPILVTIYDSSEHAIVPEFVSIAFNGTANDGTQIDTIATTQAGIGAVQPYLAGEYTVTLTVSIRGQAQEITETFTVLRRTVNWHATPYQARFFLDNPPTIFFNVLDANNDNAMVDSSYLVRESLTQQGVGAVNAITTTGTFTETLALVEAFSANHQLPNQTLSVTFGVYNRPVPTLMQNSFVFDGTPITPQLTLLNEQLVQVYSYSFRVAGAGIETSTSTPPTDVGSYIKRVNLWFPIEHNSNGIATTAFDLPFNITARPVSMQAMRSFFTQDYAENTGITLDSFDIAFMGAAPHPSLDAIALTFREYGLDMPFASIAPDSFGTYEARFEIDTPNFMAFTHTSRFFILPAEIQFEGGEASLVQTYGLTTPLVPILDEEMLQFVSLQFTGTAYDGTVWNQTAYSIEDIFAAQPTQAGGYTMSFTLMYGGGEQMVLLLSFVILPRNITLIAQDRTFNIGGIVTHNVSAYGFTSSEIPEYTVTFTDLLFETIVVEGEELVSAPNLHNLPTDSDGRFKAIFAINDANFNQLGTTTATYIVTNGRNIDSAELRYNYAFFSHTTPTLTAANVTPNSVASSQIEVVGLDAFQTVESITFQRTHAWTGANHGANNQVAFQLGTLNEVVGQPIITYPNTPYTAGVYQVNIAVRDAVVDTILTTTRTFTLYRQVVTVTNTNNTTLTRGTNVRIAANAAHGSNANNAVVPTFTVDDPWLNHMSGNGANRRRTVISRITIEGVNLVGGATFNQTINSTRPLGNTSTGTGSGGAQNMFAVTNPSSQIPATAPVGTYRITYYIDQPNFEGRTVVYFTINQRTGPSALPSNWGGGVVNRTFGQALNLTPTLADWQYIPENTPIYFEGVGSTNFEHSTTQPTAVGTYTVTTQGYADGFPITFTTTLNINPINVNFSVEPQSIPFHTLEGNPIPVSIESINFITNLTEYQRQLITFADFDVLYFRYTPNEGYANVGTSIAPIYPGRYRVEFRLANNPSFTSGIITTTFVITARTGHVRMPESTTVRPDRPVVIPIQYNDFNLERRLTFEGINVNFAQSETPPTESGIYRVVFTTVTDTVQERYEGILIISATIDTQLNDMYFDPYGVDVAFLPAFYGNANNWIEYRFYNSGTGNEILVRFDGSDNMLQRLPFTPGEYAYSVVAHGDDAPTPTTPNGMFRVTFKNTWDAFNFGQNYFATAESWFTIYSGWTAATVSTRTHTWRYRNDPRDTQNRYFFQTVNSGNNAPLVGTRTRMALRSYLPNNSAAWQTRFTDNNARRDMLNASNPMLNWQRIDEIPNIARDANDYIAYFGFLPTGLSGYTITPQTITNNHSQPIAVENGVYNFTFILNGGATDRTRIQVARFAGMAFDRFQSLSITFTLDINGRVVEMNWVDAYHMSTPLGIGSLATHTGREIFFYNPSEFPTVPEWVDPRAGQSERLVGNAASRSDFFFPQ